MASESALFRAMDAKDASPPPSPQSLLSAADAICGGGGGSIGADRDDDENAEEVDELRATDRKKREARVLSQLLLLFCTKRPEASLASDGTIHETLFTTSMSGESGEQNEDLSEVVDQMRTKMMTKTTIESAREYAVVQRFLEMPRVSQKKVVQSLFVLQPSLLDNFAPVLQFFIRIVIEAHSDSHLQHTLGSDTKASEQQTRSIDEDYANAARRIPDLHCAWARNGRVNCIELEQSDASGSDASASASSRSSASTTTTTFCFPPDFHACLVNKYGSVKRSKCEEVWHGDHMAYRCRTCGLSDSSCMCLGCFDPDDHEGHDYRVYRCSSGGCCDCGDPLAWKPEGFCKKHSAANADTSARKSSLEMKMGKLEEEVVTLLIRRTIGFCVNVLREVYLFCLRPGGAYDSDPFYPMRSLPKTGRRRNSFPEIIQVYLDRVQQALAWLQMLATSCVHYRDIISDIFFEPLPADFHLDPPAQSQQKVYAPGEKARVSLDNGAQQHGGDAVAPGGEERGASTPAVAQDGSNLLILDVFLKAGILLPVETCDVLGVLYLKLLFDHSFKQKYTCHFVEWYPYFIDLFLKASEENNEEGMRNLSRFIDRLFCQLFHSTAQLQELERVFSSTHSHRRRQRQRSPLSSGHSSCIEGLMLFLLEKLNGLFKSAARVETLRVKRRKTRDDDAQDSTTLQYVVDCGRNVFKKRIYARICSDLRTLLVHPQVAADAVLNSFRAVDGDLLLDAHTVYGELIETFKLLQQMDLQKRHVSQHIEYESQNWTFAFVVDYEVNLLLNAFLSGIPFCFPNGNTAVEEEAGGSSSKSVLSRFDLAKALLKPVREAVLSWTHQSGCPEWTPSEAFASAPEAEKMQQLMEFYQGSPVASHQDPVKKSFHLPLHHMYASLVHALCIAIRPQGALEWKSLLGFGMNESAVFSTDNEDSMRGLEFALSLVEYPLRVCFFTREVKAGLWVRNGNAMWQQLVHYYSKHWRFYGVHSDLYLCQIGALVAPRGCFTRVFLRHFPFDLRESFVFRLATSESDGVKEDQASAEVRHELDVAEEMLRLLVQILLSPVKMSTSIAPTESFTYLLEREMMHWLSLGPFSRSEVIARVDMKLVEQVKQLPEHPWNGLEEEEILTQVLETVGMYEEPSGSSAAMGGSGRSLLNFGLKMSGTWKLKPELWSKVSAYFECFTPSEAQQCEQNLRNRVQNQSRSSTRPASETPALTVPVLPGLHHGALGIHSVLAEKIFSSSDLIGALFIVLLNWRRQAKAITSNNSSGEGGGKKTSENLLLAALQCVFVGVQLLEAPDAAESDTIVTHNEGVKDDESLAVGATISDIAASFVDNLSFVTNLCASIPVGDNERTSFLSLLMEFVADDAPLEDAKVLVQQILRVVGEKSDVCRVEIEQKRAGRASESAAAGKPDSNDDDGRSQDASAGDDRARAAKEMVRRRQQMILEKMRSKQMQFLSSNGDPKDNGGAKGVAPMAVDSHGVSDEDSEECEDHDDDDDEEEDEWGFPTGQIDVQLYLDHVSSAIALSCEKQKKIYDRQRKQRRGSRNSSSSSSNLFSSANDRVGESFADEENEAEECGLCRMPCERYGSPSSFGFVGIVLPTLIPQKMRHMHNLSTPSLPSVWIMSSQSKEARSLTLSDASIWSCGHPLHHECLKSYLASLWKQKRPTDVMNGEDRLLSERDVEFQCPICRRLSNCLVPSVPQINSRDLLGRRSSLRSSDAFVEEEEETKDDDTSENLVFVKWLNSQMSFQDDRPQVKRRKSRALSYLRSRLNSSAAERDRLSAVERNLDRFYHDVTLRCLRAAMQLPLLMTEAIQDEVRIDAEIQNAVCTLDVQLPAWQLFLHCLEVQVDLIEQERESLHTDPLDKQRMQSLRYLADVTVAASALSAENALSWTVIDAPYETKFDVMVGKLNGILFGHQVLFEEDDGGIHGGGLSRTESERSSNSKGDFRAALPILCHPNLFSFFVMRMVWRQGSQATSPHVAVEELVSEAFFLSRVLVTAQLLQSLCCIQMRAGNEEDEENKGLSDERTPVFEGDDDDEEEKLPSFGGFERVQSLKDAYHWVSQLLTRSKLVGNRQGFRSSSAAPKKNLRWRSDMEEEVSAMCLPLVKRMVLLMDVLLPPSSPQQHRSQTYGPTAAAEDEVCAVCDGIFSSDPLQSAESKRSAGREKTQELEKYLRRLHLPPLRLFFQAQMFASDQRGLCELWGAQLEAKAAVLRQQAQQQQQAQQHDEISASPVVKTRVNLFASISKLSALGLASKEPSARPRLLMSLPRIYMNLFILYNDKPRGLCQQCQQLPQHPAICLFCGVVLCCFSPCCESARGNIGECSQHAQTCGLGFGAFMLLRACTVILFLGNERRCVWGSVYVDKNGEEDPYLRRGKTLYLDASRLLALESLLVSHGFSQNTAILANTSRRDGRRY
ncbi:putative ubiquitin-protein ligase of the n-recognin family [Globisporangium polare]